MRHPWDLAILLLLIAAGGAWGVMVATWLGWLVIWILGA